MALGEIRGGVAGRVGGGSPRSARSTGSVSPNGANKDSGGVNTQNKTLSKQNYLGTLLPEILEKIASRLNKSDLLHFRQVCKNASEIGHYIDHTKKAWIFFKKKESIKTHIPNDIKSLILIHTPSADDAKKIFGAIPGHVNQLRLTTLPSAADAPGVLGAIPGHVNHLVLTTLPSAADAQRIFGAIPGHVNQLLLSTLPSAADAPGVLGAIPPHVRFLGLTNLPSAADAPGVLGAIPRHITSLRLTTLPSAADAQTYKNAIPLGIVHNIP